MFPSTIKRTARAKEPGTAIGPLLHPTLLLMPSHFSSTEATKPSATSHVRTLRELTGKAARLSMASMLAMTTRSMAATRTIKCSKRPAPVHQLCGV